MLPYWVYAYGFSSCGEVKTLRSLTYIVVCKHETVLDGLGVLVDVVQVRSVLDHRVSELGPRHSAHVAVGLPRVDNRVATPIAGRALHLGIEVGDDLGDIIQPLVPVLPHARAVVPLMLKQVDAVVQLPHPLGNLARGVGLAQVQGLERDGVEELLETAVLEGAQQARANLLAGKALEDLELVVAVDEVLHLWAVDAQQNLGRRLLAFAVGKIGRGSDDVYGIGQRAAQALDLDEIAAVQRHAPPSLEPQRVSNANDFVFETQPRVSLLVGLVGRVS